MVIEITEKPTSHCWVVRMDALEVNFKSLGDAQAFVGQLKTRIDAPHAWPKPPGSAAFARPLSVPHSASPKGEAVHADIVE